MRRYLSLLLLIGLAMGQSAWTSREAVTLADMLAEEVVILKTAVIYLRNGERIDGDIVEIDPAGKYIVVRTKRENRKRIRYRDINYILHNNNGLADYLLAAAKEPEPEPLIKGRYFSFSFVYLVNTFWVSTAS